VGNDPDAVTGLDRFNALPRDAAVNGLLACCGSRAWAEAMADRRPFARPADTLDAADRIWRSLSRSDWLEAFRAHPRIGELASGTAAAEQAGARAAPPAVREALAKANRDYEERFGYIFIVCATGKSAEEMLAICRSRLHNDDTTELSAAAEEQRRITRIRLEKYLGA
jgi:OHCU decarboxylase